MVSVTREEFEVRSELEAVHLPTGAVFSAYPYSNPEDMLRSIQVQWGRAGSPPLSADDVEQIILEELRRGYGNRRLANHDPGRLADSTIAICNAWNHFLDVSASAPLESA